MTRRMPGRAASAPVTSAGITRVLRVLFPVPIHLRTDTLDPDPQGRALFRVTLPATSAGQLGLRPSAGTSSGSRWLTERLGLPAEVTAVEYLRWSARGQTARVTVAVTQPGGDS